jgi:hypothetical protein
MTVTGHQRVARRLGATERKIEALTRLRRELPDTLKGALRSARWFAVLCAAEPQKESS